MSEGKESAQLEVANKLKKSSNYILIGVGLVMILVILTYSAYFGFYVDLKVSEDPEAWVHFSTIFSNFLSPTIAAAVLWFVVRSYYLQKSEFEGMRNRLSTQIEIDTLIRKQQMIASEGREILSLIYDMLERDIEASSDEIEFMVSSISYSKSPSASASNYTVLQRFFGLQKRGDNLNFRITDKLKDLEQIWRLINILSRTYFDIDKIDRELNLRSELASQEYASTYYATFSTKIRPIVEMFYALNAVPRYSNNVFGWYPPSL